jgi:hypothetical protein
MDQYVPPLVAISTGVGILIVFNKKAFPKTQVVE